jgi:DNA-binding HxlR family transcriptional regulator
MRERLISLSLIYKTLGNFMLRYLPKWIMRRAKVLWGSFKSRHFTFSEAEKALDGDDSRMVAVVLSELKRAGWIAASVDAENPRKKLYRFTHPATMEEVVKIDFGE